MYVNNLHTGHFPWLCENPRVTYSAPQMDPKPAGPCLPATHSSCFPSAQAESRRDQVPPLRLRYTRSRHNLKPMAGPSDGEAPDDQSHGKTKESIDHGDDMGWPRPEKDLANLADGDWTTSMKQRFKVAQPYLTSSDWRINQQSMDTVTDFLHVHHRNHTQLERLAGVTMCNPQTVVSVPVGFSSRILHLLPNFACFSASFWVDICCYILLYNICYYHNAKQPKTFATDENAMGRNIKRHNLPRNRTARRQCQDTVIFLFLLVKMIPSGYLT